jgi:membrane protein insertase Oxa1/YidC/SpoIIIJ
MLSTLLQPLMALEELALEGLHAVGLAWGTAIVALSILVRLALIPLAMRRSEGTRPRRVLAGFVVQVLVVMSLAALLYDDAAAGTFGDAGWLFIQHLSEPAPGAALTLLLGAYVGLRLVSLRLAARAGRRRVAIALLAPVPLLLAATQIPAGVLVFVLASVAFGVAQKLVLRAPAPAQTPVPAPQAT